VRSYRSPIRILTALVVLLGAWGFWLEPASLRVREYRFSIPRWPSSLAGIRAAILADLHVGSPFNGVNKLRRIVAATNASQPDIVLLPGDFVIHGVLGGRFVPPEETAAILAGLRAPLGVWACLGNHDWWFNHTRVQAALEARGIRVLEDRAVRIDRGSAHFWLAGVSDFWEGNHDVDGTLGQVEDNEPVLAITHNPDLFPRFPSRVSLVIAGHTHGGQVWLPIFGRPVVPSGYGQRYVIGEIVEGDRHLFVSSGLGTSILPVRFLVPPEISVLALHPAKGPD